MKQLLQSLKDGETSIVDVPAPFAKPGELLIETSNSLISSGTERMLLEFGKGNLIAKARQQPDKVREVFYKMTTDGVAATLDAVQHKLNQPIPLGYSNVGKVIAIGRDVSGFTLGDRIVSNGPHAGIVSVPKNLCAKIPDNVSDETAAFTVVGAIGLQGVRLANSTIGDCVVVIGLGLIGLMTVQILRAQGCRVLGVDTDPVRVEHAKKIGAEAVNISAGENPLSAAKAFSRGNGVDAVLITASTQSNDPVTQAAHMCRKRGKIVLVGISGLSLNRADFYEKELTFQVSCSYGPGRYDPNYEDLGQDYPIGFVRWTEQRNFEAILDLMDAGTVNTDTLISHRFDIESGKKAMEVLSSSERSLGIILSFKDTNQEASDVKRTVVLGDNITSSTPASSKVSFVGAGNYAGKTLIPAFRKGGAVLETVVSSGGTSSIHFGKKYKFNNASTNINDILQDDKTDTVVIATRHNLHAEQVLGALRNGKHVFCEKPLCLTLDELHEIEKEAYKRKSQKLMVGFNRRFSPHIIKISQLLDTINCPKNFVMTINAGDIPPENWTQRKSEGGGRIIGEACHFIDLLRFLTKAPIIDHKIFTLGQHPNLSIREDKATIVLSFSDGSLGTINYLSNGHKSIPKERLEIFVDGRTLQLDNYRKLVGHGWEGFSKMTTFRQDKGQEKCAADFMTAVKENKSAPIQLPEIIEVTRVTLNLANSVHE